MAKTGLQLAPLLTVLRDPEIVAAFNAQDWELLIRQARRLALLDRVGHLIEASTARDTVPTYARPHFTAARRYAQAQSAEIKREVGLVDRALGPLGIDVVLLKGAAYLMSGQPAALGRTYSDIDFLVPRHSLARAEAALTAHGWETTHHDPYDQRYYRKWMHELPPMRHRTRGTVIDVHHGILPMTARLRPDSSLLLESAVPLLGTAMKVLCPADMVLHSLTHLYQDDAADHGLRDLSDVDMLFRGFAATEGFWESVCERARLLDLRAPLAQGVLLLRRLFATPIPASVDHALWQGASASLADRMQATMQLRAISATHPTTRTPGSGPATTALFLRSNWLKMPAPLLARHLAVKAWRSQFPPKREGEADR